MLPSSHKITSSALCLLGAGCLHLAWASPPLGVASHVLHVSVDGLRGDLLQDLVVHNPSVFSNFHRLQTEGAYTYNARTDFTHTITVPNHICMLTGRPVLQPEGQPVTVPHGYGNNFPNQDDTIHRQGNTNLAYVASAFDVVHDHGLSTAFYFGKSRLDILARSYNETNGAPDTMGQDDGRNKVDSVVLITYTFGLIDALVDHLTNAPPNYTFLHITDPDAVGHRSGWGSLEWSNAIVKVDLYLGRLLAAIDQDPLLKAQSVLLVSADHGGGGEDPNYHGDPRFLENHTIPFFLWGSAVPSGVNLYHLMGNRHDPGRSIPDYNDPRQPIRNGDGANLALQFLGLEPVPGSVLLPELSLEPPIALSWIREDTRLLLQWDTAGQSLVLEGKETLQSQDWRPVQSGIEGSGGTRSLTLDLNGSHAYRFYRLRKE